MGATLQIEFHQHDWIDGFAAFAPDATTPSPDSKAFCVLNVGAFLAAVEAGDIPTSELPYIVAESMMHEVIHVLEQWAGVEFNEDRVEALLARYRDSDGSPKGGNGVAGAVHDGAARRDRPEDSAHQPQGDEHE